MGLSALRRRSGDSPARAVWEEAAGDRNAPAHGEAGRGSIRLGVALVPLARGSCALWVLRDVPVPRGTRCLAAAHPQDGGSA